MGKKVIVAGHICLDITPVFPDKKVSGVGEMLAPGKLIEMGNADMHTGGAVANTGLALKLLGADVSLMGKTGRDAFGDMVVEILKKYGASEGLIRAEGESTSYSVVLAIPGIDRIFLHHPGANHTFRAEDVPWDRVEDAALFHFGYPPLMRSMYADGGTELVNVLRTAREAGAATSLDLAAVDVGSEAGQADWREILERALPFVDFFVPSMEELCFMIDRKRYDSWQRRAAGGDITEVLSVEEDIRPVARQCMEMGAKVLLLKCGAPGMYLCTADEKTLSGISGRTELDAQIWADQAFFEKSYVPGKVLSGTGAGDTSIAAFLQAVLEGEDPKMAMHLAAAEGASCVEAYDALGGLKSLEELKRKIEAGWEKREA